MPPIISVENLSKRYLVGHQSNKRERYTALRDVLARQAKSLVRKTADVIRGRQIVQGDEVEEFWALKDVSFQVQPGEVLGVIGRNGAGKSTLLKILSRITDPTCGRVTLRGRVASLLEVGTGFHPELSGRENVFLNGAILGMTRNEIRLKFDAIVDFAGVERFLDTPVKRYSSGMYVRLAFAVAAHLDPEILVVDEVLAVGDAEFQKKCLGKMQDVAAGGRTVLFVSHNMAAISSLCTSALVLRAGCVETRTNNTADAIEAYHRSISGMTAIPLSERRDRDGDGQMRITNFEVVDEAGQEKPVICSGDYVEFRIRFHSQNAESRNVAAGIGIASFSGAYMAELSNKIASFEFPEAGESGCICCRIEKMPLAPGNYSLNLILRQNDIIQDWIKDAVTLVVEEGDYYGNGRMPTPGRGGFLMQQDWFLLQEVHI